MPFEFGGQTWPDTNVVSERFEVIFIPSPDHRPVRYELCYYDYRDEEPHTDVCTAVTDIVELPDGTFSGLVRTLREGDTDSPAWLEAVHTDLRPDGTAEVLYSAPSNEVALPTARPWDLPEPGLVTLVTCGVIFLSLFAKVLRRKVDT